MKSKKRSTRPRIEEPAYYALKIKSWDWDCSHAGDAAAGR
jgi:hypothetical protein